MSQTTLFHFASDSDDQDAVEALDGSSGHGVLIGRAKSKMSGACADCKAVKVRCEIVSGHRKCRRCELKNLPCTPRERKKRKPADTHEELQERARNQDRRIQQLLREYDEMKADHKIRQWITKFHPISTVDGYDRMAQCYKWMQEGTSPEEAAALSFGLPDRTHVPEIVKHCALYPEEIVELFSLFFKHVNPYFSILDDELHTPHHLIRTSPFLFTVLCAVSSRYYVSRPEIYPLAMDFARDAAGKGLVEGKQSVDMCQAYLIMAVYPVPKKKWVEDRSWLLMGVAIRMAMELKLNQPPPSGLTERERLNYTRTWLNCYCVDGSHAIQFGKMPMLRLDDYLARSSANWYRSSQMNTAFDVHLVAYVQILLLMAQWKSIVAQQLENGSTEIVEAAIRMHGRLAKEMDHWVEEYAHELSYRPLPICVYRGNTTQM
ncbi:hypothetical protein EST38_g1742 [Candolleomyces aberdarensis]|uniref:Zn(2)-C6 fungal-type domain-containing protein n=1 Tax=Candolleomyces aberdarensis TaxID=2316362 RepID=A0A4Q2DUS7_9AGAR|nr:hypothetical protein EST38_g1742 [Candolleomyces aberdarensis]